MRCSHFDCPMMGYCRPIVQWLCHMWLKCTVRGELSSDELAGDDLVTVNVSDYEWFGY